MDEAKRIQIHDMKMRNQYALLSYHPAFLDSQTAAFLLDICEHKVEELFEAGAIPFVTLQDQRLIPLVSLLDEMEWYPAIAKDEIEHTREAATESHNGGGSTCVSNNGQS